MAGQAREPYTNDRATDCMADDAPNLHTSPAKGPERDFAAQRLQLLQRLLTSQEPSILVTRFFEMVAPKLGYTGLIYQQPLKAQSLELGAGGRHQCDYRLSGEHQDLGHITFLWDRRFSEATLAELEEWLSLLVLPLGNALRYQEARQLALVDPLTGLGNRAAMDAALHRELRLAERMQTDLSMLVIDIDHFKRLNDRLGHSEGDQVLKRVALLIAGGVRESDLVYRYGGEEFVVLLSNTGPKGAAVIAERLRLTVAQAFEPPGKASGVSISLGISSRRSNGETSLHSLFDRADQALYRAKAEGRNRVAPEEAPPARQSSFSVQSG